MPTDIGDSITAGGVAGRISIIAAFLLLNAIFVAAEYSLAALSPEADEQQPTPTTAIRLGSSLASLALGVVAGPIWFAGVAMAHIILGWLLPGSIAIERPLQTSRVAVPVVRFFAKITSPVVWVLDVTTNTLLRALGFEDANGSRPAHTPDQLRSLVMKAHASGSLDESDRAMLAAVFDFKQKKASDVMRPRTEIVAIDIESTEEEVRSIVSSERYSRYPVYRDTLDDVVGVFLAKDLWLREADQSFDLHLLLREALYVPDGRPAARILDDLQKTRAYMAIVLDEYGGTSGIISVEDLVEEVMGDIADEYDQASRTALELDGILELAGSLSIIDARSDYRLDIPEGEWSTLGGFVFSQLGRLPKVGDKVQLPDAELEVVAMDGRRVAALRIHRGAPLVPSEVIVAANN